MTADKCEDDQPMSAVACYASNGVYIISWLCKLIIHALPAGILEGRPEYLKGRRELVVSELLTNLARGLYCTASTG